MSNSMKNLLRPKKKRRVRVTRHAPFPVPVRSITLDRGNPGKWLYYKGQLTGSSVVVHSSGDLHYLKNMGFFGRGNLSKGGTTYSQSFPNTSADDPGLNSLRVMKRQIYIRHLNWQKEMKARESGDPREDWTLIDEYDSSQEHSPGQTGLWEQDYHESNKWDVDSDQNVSTVEINDKVTTETQIDWTRKREECIDDNEWELYRKPDQSSSVMKDKTVSADELWDRQQVDEDFWLCDDVPKSKPDSMGVENAKVEPDTDDFLERDNEGDNSSQSESASNENSAFERTSAVVQASQTAISGHSQGQTESADSREKCCNRIGRDCSVAESEFSGNVTVIHDDCDIDSDCNNVTGCDNNSHTNYDQDGRIQCQVNRQDTNIAHVDHCQIHHTDTAQQESQKDAGLYEHSSGVESAKLVDPLCGEHEDGGDVLVVSDGDGDNADECDNMLWNRVIKQDPYPMTENLQLSLEEAFFLSYGLGCLVCLSHAQKPMDLCEMWQTFCDSRQSFLPNYIAYHYLRSKGWVPKPGVKFGTDFIVYKEGPPFYHATYSVVVRMLDHTLRDDPAYISRSRTWTSLSGLNRITENVAKEVLFCFVVPPSGAELTDLSSPKCIPEFQVQVMAMKRWVPAQERENKPQEDLEQS